MKDFVYQQQLDQKRALEPDSFSSPQSDDLVFENDGTTPVCNPSSTQGGEGEHPRVAPPMRCHSECMWASKSLGSSVQDFWGKHLGDIWSNCTWCQVLSHQWDSSLLHEVQKIQVDELKTPHIAHSNEHHHFQKGSFQPAILDCRRLVQFDQIDKLGLGPWPRFPVSWVISWSHGGTNGSSFNSMFSARSLFDMFASSKLSTSRWRKWTAFFKQTWVEHFYIRSLDDLRWCCGRVFFQPCMLSERRPQGIGGATAEGHVDTTSETTRFVSQQRHECSCEESWMGYLAFSTQVEMVATHQLFTNIKHLAWSWVTPLDSNLCRLCQVFRNIEFKTWIWREGGQSLKPQPFFQAQLFWIVFLLVWSCVPPPCCCNQYISIWFLTC